MQGPEGRPPNVSPARKGWEIDPEEDPSAVGAALNRSSTLPVSLGAKPTCPGVPWRDLRLYGPFLEMFFLPLLRQNPKLETTISSGRARLMGYDQGEGFGGEGDV
jgi:hypothetical protein